ncbi:uncharacterized protein LOC135378213 isoform X2 [Ornithodoros turicata]|uniref:uncharacterized protein LOC135378213 isoform X2 n=1 Tax=Ornithodoros turicata TaxID=34597 RepID=UPI003139F140
MATWERELPRCAGSSSACSIVHHRYWQSPHEIRLCRCPHRDACPTGFGDDPATTVNITRRTQLKMCPSWSPESCSDGALALVMRTQRKIQGPSNRRKQLHVDVRCRCSHTSGTYYSRTHGNNTANITHYEQHQHFKCMPLSDCSAGDFCGHVARDYYATYKRCHCPAGHLCTVPYFNRTIVAAVREVMYEAPAYRALCLPRT